MPVARLRLASLVAIAIGSAFAVHLLPLAIGSIFPSLELVAIALIASFFVLHPSLTVPLFFVLRRESSESNRSALVRAGMATGAASGALVLLCQALVEAALHRARIASLEPLAPLLYLGVGATYGALAGFAASFGRKNTSS